MKNQFSAQGKQYFVASNGALKRVRGSKRRRASLRAGSPLVGKLARFAGRNIRVGRNVIKGYPVDIPDQDPNEGGLEMEAVDRGAASDLLDELRAAGFKVRRHSNTGLVVEASFGKRAGKRASLRAGSDPKKEAYRIMTDVDFKLTSILRKAKLELQALRSEAQRAGDNSAANFIESEFNKLRDVQQAVYKM